MSELQVPTPCYLIDRTRLKENLAILDGIRQRVGCKILFSQKAFACYPFYSMMSRYLDGTAATGEYEAQLGHLYFHGENHVCSTVYRPEEMENLCKICDHITFNSPRQLHRFGGQAVAAGCKVGLRVNPELPLQRFSDYDPCAPHSRFGATLAQFPREDRRLISGLHVHALYEQNSDALEQLVDVVIRQYAGLLPSLEWINLGGGHALTRPEYDIDRLEKCVHRLQEYGLTVYLEPGEAIAWKAGLFVTTVLDIVENGLPVAILDASAVCHTPDVTELGYHPPLQQAVEEDKGRYLIRIAGRSCLPEDVFGDYCFDHPLQIGSQLVFEDMAINTITKAVMYTGMPLPCVAVKEPDGSCTVLHSFSFSDYKNRM
ncbi:MAG: carboxynorspermidine decarboxylase [Oscillospiraceae bacterium]